MVFDIHVRRFCALDAIPPTRLRLVMRKISRAEKPAIPHSCRKLPFLRFVRTDYVLFLRTGVYVVTDTILAKMDAMGTRRKVTIPVK